MKMGKRNSLGDYSLEMQLIQKKIEHIINSIAEDKLKRVQNPRGMRELRKRLFVNLKRLLKVKLKKNKSLKKNDIGLLRKYSNKLHKWQKYLNEQQNELQEKEQKEFKLDNKMQKLNKQLKELPQTHNKRKEIPPARVNIPNSGTERKSQVKKRNRKVKFAKYTNQKRYTVPSTIIDYSRRSSSFSGPRKTLSAESAIKLRDILENIEKSTTEKQVEREIISEPDLLPVKSQQFLSSHDKRLDPYFRDIRKSISAQLNTNQRLESRRSSRMSTKSLSSLRLKRLKKKLQQHVHHVGSGTQTPQHTVPVVIATPTHKLHISDIDALVIPKIISAGLFTQKTLKSPHWKLFQRVVAENKKSFGEEFIENVDDTTKRNLRSVHSLLKDVIQGPSMLDIIADRNGILRIVRRHYMWKNLAGVYSDMSSVGVGKKEIYNVLRNQYLENIDEIFNEAMENGMALVSEREPTISVDDIQFHNLHMTDSNENLMNALRFKRTSASREGSIASGGSDRQSVLSLAIKDLSDVNNRYSLTNLKNIQKAHVTYFASLKKTPLEIQLQQQKNAMKKELRKQSRLQSTKECKKKQKKLQQNVDNNRLYYEPRKTCRERSILDDELQDCNCLEPLCTPKCMRCGAEMPSLDAMEVNSSSSKLSLYSIAACGKNKDLLHLTSDICDQCGFVHHQRSPCPMLIEASPSRTMQQLRWIKEIAPYAEDRCQMLKN